MCPKKNCLFSCFVLKGINLQRFLRILHRRASPRLQLLEAPVVLYYTYRRVMFREDGGKM